MDVSSLKALIDSDAANAAKSDADVDIWLMADETKYRHLSDGEFRSVIVLHDLEGVWEAAEVDAASEVSGVKHRALAKAALGMLRRAEGIDMGDKDLPAMLDLMVSANLLGASGVARTALENKAAVTQSRWAHAAFPVMDQASRMYWIAEARS